MVATETCLTDEELAAYIDGMALPDERERVQAHLASCPICQEIYLATVGFQQESRSEEEPVRAPLPFPKRRVPIWLGASMAAAAAAALAVSVGPLFFGSPHFGATDLLAGLNASIAESKPTVLTTPAALAAQIYTPPVMRGPEDDKSLEIKSRDFQTGVRLVGLLLNLQVKNSPKADESLSALSRFADQASEVENKQVWESARGALQRGAAGPTLLGPVQKAEERLRKQRDEEGYPEFRFGEWTEASRLAALGKLPSYFEKRDFRRYLDWIEKHEEVQKNAEALAALHSIDRTLAKPHLVPADFDDLQQRFLEIIKAYQRPSDLTG
jgi:Putative zinc-finger